MEKTIKAMQKRHEREIKKLQKNCHHEKIGPWVGVAIIGGSGPGYDKGRTCLLCGKVMETRNKSSKQDGYRRDPQETT
jgi:hypothetical protein